MPPALAPDLLPRTHGRAALGFVLVTVMLDMLAMAVIIPVLPRLVLGFEGGNTARSAEILGLFGTVWALMQFLCAPLLGAASDRFGRRAVILVSNLGLGLDYVLMALAPSLAVLFLGRVISGITAASVATAGAYIADVSPPDRRAAGFGLINVAFGLGFVLGPAMGGVLGHTNPRLPFWVAAGLSLGNAAWGLFVLPESLPPARRTAFVWRRASPLGALALLRTDRRLLGLGAVNFISGVAQQSLLSTFVLYTAYRYHWDARTTGLTLAGVGVCAVVVGGLLVRPLVRWFGERRVLLASLLFGVAGFLTFGFARSGPVFWAGVPLMALWGLATPAAQGLMTRRVSAADQGRLQGAGGSLLGIAGMVGPGLFTLTFALFIGRLGWLDLPGAPFLLAALLLAGTFPLALLVTRGDQRPVGE